MSVNTDAELGLGCLNSGWLSLGLEQPLIGLPYVGWHTAHHGRGRNEVIEQKQQLRHDD